MSNQTMVPCTSGKCGVKSHILGSAEQKACGGTGIRSSGSTTSLASAPTLNQTPQSVAFQEYRSELEAQTESAKKLRSALSEVPAPRTLKDRLLGRRDDPEARKAQANQEYLEGGHEERIKRSFNRALSTAMQARPSVPEGESVQPLRSGGRTLFSDITYKKDDDRSITVTATGPDGSDMNIRYSGGFEGDYASISFRGEYYGRSVSMPYGDSYEWKRAAYPTDPRRGDSDHALCNQLIDLLDHCQNEKNWSA